MMAPDSSSSLFTIQDIVGTSEPITQLKEKILKIASSRSNVLIYGETGTGKELVAQSIHSHSKRRQEAFLAINCAAIPHSLLESIFFGTTKGSFTGAVDSKGMFERANEGTVFLDEINSMDLSLQAKVLRVIEEGKVTRVGGTTQIPIDVRIISTTNQKPKISVMNGTLRQDLYYRISTLQIELPPLRKRKEDIDILTEYFIEQYNKETGKQVQGLDSQVRSAFHSLDWPGNVRELKNAIESAFSYVQSPLITLKDIPDYLLEETDNDAWAFDESEEFIPSVNVDMHLPLREAMESFEREYIFFHAEKAQSLVDLARRLSISKQLLHHKIKKYNLTFHFTK